MTTRPRMAVSFGLLMFALATVGCRGGAATPQSPSPAPVFVARAEVRTVPVALRAIGSVEPIASVAVRARVGGQILKVHIADGVDVERGQTLFTIDPEPQRIALTRAEAQLGRDQALLQKTQSDVARYATLVEKEYVTREQYESTVSQAASQAETIRDDQAAVEEARLNLSYCSITAPISGRTGVVTQRAGNLVKANDDPPLVTILQVRPVYVTFSVPERQLAAIRAHADKAPLEVRAWNRGETGEGHRGTLTFIDNAVDTATGTIRLRGEFPNDDRGLWPGEFVEVSLTVSEQSDVVVVPSPAVQVGQQGNYVYVVGADGTARLQPVVVDRVVGADSIIADGVAGGDTVIIDGQLRVIPGAKVAVQAEP